MALALVIVAQLAYILSLSNTPSWYRQYRCLKVPIMPLILDVDIRTINYFLFIERWTDLMCLKMNICGIIPCKFSNSH
jgi:hypothetical protein